MKQIKQDFLYEKYKNSGETKDVAKLYLNFFIFLKMDGKVNDLKRAYANNKFMGVIFSSIFFLPIYLHFIIKYPIISALMKWMIEITRECFQNTLKEKVKEAENILGVKNKNGTSNNYGQKFAQCINVIRPTSTIKARINPNYRTVDQPLKKQASENNIEFLEQNKKTICLSSLPNKGEFMKNNCPETLDKSGVGSSGKTFKTQTNTPLRYLSL